MRRICFIGNFYKTAVYEAIADELEKYGCRTYWIISNPTQYKYYAGKYGEDRVLLTDRTLISENSKPVDDFKINEIIYGHRVWQYQMQKGMLYLTSIQGPVYQFIFKNSIQIIFGENTLGEELLISRMCQKRRELKCKYFSLMTARIPDDRVFFFEDEKQSVVWRGKEESSEESISVEVKKPDYLTNNNKRIAYQMSIPGLLKRLKYFITNEHIDKTDPDVITDKFIRFKVRTKEVINQQQYRFIKRSSLSDLEGKKFVFFGFHKQPESSIDVCGRYKEDQRQTVLNIWRQLPDDWYLVIKEHSNAIGDRGYKFFKEFREYPRIIILNECTDAYSVMNSAQLVITNTGTMGLEAALKGVPAVTLSRVAFNCLNYCKYMSWEDFEKYDSLVDLVNEIKALPRNNEDYLELVRKYSFKGKMGDTDSNPNFLNDKKNLANLVSAFLSVIRRTAEDI